MALGGLASGFGMGPGVSLPRCGRRDGGGVVVVLGGPAPRGGVGGLVLGCVVDAAGPPRPRFAVPPRLWGGVRVGVCGVVVRVGLLVPVG